jgi:Tfp pilus assembly protein PilO
MKSKKAEKKFNKNKKRDYQLLSFVLFTIAFFAIFAIRPAVSLIYNLQKEKSEYEKIDKELETKIQAIISTQAQFMELINNKKYVDEALPNSPLPSTKVVSATQKFLKKELTVNSFNIQNITVLPQTEAGLKTVSINLTGSSNYQDFLDFLDFLHNSRRLFSLNSLDLTTEMSSSSATLNFSSLLNTYYFVEKETSDAN